MRKHNSNKYHCLVCHQTVEPTADGSCPLCNAPSSMLVLRRDLDDDENNLNK